MAFKCGGRLKHFGVRTGTVTAGSTLPLQTWLLAFYMVARARKVSVASSSPRNWELHRKLLDSFSSTSGRLDNNGQDLLTGEVEVDEAYLSGKEP